MVFCWSMTIGIVGMVLVEKWNDFDRNRGRYRVRHVVSSRGTTALLEVEKRLQPIQKE